MPENLSQEPACSYDARAAITATFSAFAESDATQILGEDGGVKTLRKNLERRCLENRTIPLAGLTGDHLHDGGGLCQGRRTKLRYRKRHGGGVGEFEDRTAKRLCRSFAENRCRNHPVSRRTFLRKFPGLGREFAPM